MTVWEQYRDARAVPCPHCGVMENERCRSGSRYLRGVHKARWVLFKSGGTS